MTTKCPHFQKEEEGPSLGSNVRKQKFECMLGMSWFMIIIPKSPNNNNKTLLDPHCDTHTHTHTSVPLSEVPPLEKCLQHSNGPSLDCLSPPAGVEWVVISSNENSPAINLRSSHFMKWNSQDVSSSHADEFKRLMNTLQMSVSNEACWQFSINRTQPFFIRLTLVQG